MSLRRLLAHKNSRPNTTAQAVAMARDDSPPPPTTTAEEPKNEPAATRAADLTGHPGIDRYLE